jgi:hypothetical protein
MRTMAPKLFGGRLRLNCALTIPELPGNKRQCCSCDTLLSYGPIHDRSRHLTGKLTVCPRHLAPHNLYLRATDLLLAPVDIGDALAKVEAGGFGVVDAFDRDEGGVGVGCPLACVVPCQSLSQVMWSSKGTNRAGTRCACP